MINLGSTENCANLGYYVVSSGNSYNYTLLNNLEGRSFQVFRDGSLKSRIGNIGLYNFAAV
jgi:hypothetical protein